MRSHIGSGIPATGESVESDLFEVSIDLGLDLFVFADDLIGETADEKAARLDAAADIVADDPSLYLATVALVARSLTSAGPSTGAAIYLLPSAVRPKSGRAAA
ncbi:hypothetical protein KV557_24770 [Kitasatospora aureofaciens]|uniref:hypothetical protein n=1 Tax=Kitasatospora aureofaciens TaxID=1894 RepID=UPI001C45CA2F|nr:hypothetical protein [Kitasatospora aureofaciens]MBV6700279.1 hypothetical protein [Kitasatospora aureofaciens]